MAIHSSTVCACAIEPGPKHGRRNAGRGDRRPVRAVRNAHQAAFDADGAHDGGQLLGPLAIRGEVQAAALHPRCVMFQPALAERGLLVEPRHQFAVGGFRRFVGTESTIDVDHREIGNRVRPRAAVERRDARGRRSAERIGRP